VKIKNSRLADQGTIQVITLLFQPQDYRQAPIKKIPACPFTGCFAGAVSRSVLAFKLKANNYAQLKPPLEPQPPVEGAWLRLGPEESPGPEKPVLQEKLDIIFWTSGEPHLGHFTSLHAWGESTNLSNPLLH